ncbi:uncharacterized protein LOC114020693 [Chelonia mydas]|uniref:uncharacterized protein LOC114020693 n=1 Tax=Chelonia mydas TaxID=8469 RepID=UPI0018A20332|nr:uncharacterized protein LOC114020693 [Chelonia mydas]
MRLVLWVALLRLAAGSRQRGHCLGGCEFWVEQRPPWAARPEGASLEMSCTVEPPPPPGALRASWHRGRLATGLGQARLENGSTSVLSTRALRGHDSGVYRCHLVLLLSGQPCLLLGPGTHLLVTGPPAQNTTWPGLQENTTRSEPRRRGLPPHHWTIRLLALGAGIVLTAAVVLCLPRRRGRENRE